MKAISAIIATIMLLMISVAMVGVFYVFSSGIATTSTSAAGEQASQLTRQLSSCMRIDNINGNQVLLTNCGKGIIENKSLVVMMDDVKLSASTNTISEDSSGTINITGLWQISPGKRTLKISNGAAIAQALVEVKPNPDGLVGSWGFDEGSGTVAVDGSGNGNVGTLLPLGSEPAWVSGKFNKGLQFDGTNDYMDVPHNTILQPNGTMAVSAWIKVNTNEERFFVSKGSLWAGGNSWYIYEQSDGQFGFIRYYGGGSNSESKWTLSGAGNLIGDNQWHYVVGVDDGNVLKVYIDGIQKGTPTTVTGLTAFTSETNPLAMFRMGVRNYWYNGTIDEVRIWNKSFTPDETVVMKQII